MANGKIAGVWNNLQTDPPRMPGMYWLRAKHMPYTVWLAHLSNAGVWRVFIHDGSTAELTGEYTGWLPVKTPHGNAYN